MSYSLFYPACAILSMICFIGCVGNKELIYTLSPDQRNMHLKVHPKAVDVSDDIKHVLSIAGKTGVDSVHFSAGVYPLSVPIRPYTGLVLIGEKNKVVVLDQRTWGHPVIDVLNADSCSVLDMKLVSHQKRVYPNGFESRGTDAYVTNAGIYSNSHAGTFRNLTISGFTCGIFLSSWNGKGLYEQKDRNNVDNVRVDSVDFGLLVTGQKQLNISHVSGSYVKQHGSGGAPHLIYISDSVDPAHVWTENFSVRNCKAQNSTGGHAYQMGSAKNGTLVNLLADSCSGILAVENFVNITIDTLIATDDQTQTVGSVFMQPENIRDVVMNYVYIESKNPDALLLLLDGERNRYENVILKSAINKVTDQNLVVFKGRNSVLRHISAQSRSDSVGAVVVLVEGTQMEVDGITCMGCRAAFNVHADCKECKISYDSREVTPPTGYTSFVHYFDPFHLAQIIDRAIDNN